VVSKRGEFECRVPDLGALGGEYCVSQQPSGPKRFLANRCGAKLGRKDFLVEPAPWPVELHSVDLPQHKLRLSPSDRETSIAWAMSACARSGRQMVHLDPSSHIETLVVRSRGS
jgi:hypothetical protein